MKTVSAREQTRMDSRTPAAIGHPIPVDGASTDDDPRRKGLRKERKQRQARWDSRATPVAQKEPTGWKINLSRKEDRDRSLNASSSL